MDRQAQVEALMRRGPVIPVIQLARAEDAVPLAQALVAGGVAVLEVTLRTPVALEAIRRIAREVEGAQVGAGTVLNAGQLAAAVEAGATFAVSPGATPALLRAAMDCPVPLLPGASTASEVMLLLEQEYRHQKFFPAEPAGGVAMLKALAAPLPEARFCPTGGIGPANAASYLALGNVLCVGGSWIVPASAIAAGDWSRITELAREAAALPR